MPAHRGAPGLEGALGARAIAAGLLIAALVAVGISAEGAKRFKKFRSTVNRLDLPLRSFRSLGLVRNLTGAGLLTARPRPDLEPDGSTQVSRGDAIVLRADGGNIDSGPLPSTRAVPPSAVARGSAILSVVLPRHELDSPSRGLHANSEKRGGAWERAAVVSYFSDGILRFESGAGIRVHGGESRTSPIFRSYRLKFENRYGSKRMPLETLIPEASGKLSEVVISSDLRRGIKRRDDFWQFINPLAYDLFRATRGIAPKTSPVRFYLNGQFKGVFVATEYVDTRFLRERFGHDRFTVARSKDEGENGETVRGDKSHYRKLRHWALAAPAPLTIESADHVVDIENLSRWLLLQVFLGNVDPFQGPKILDMSESRPRWRWVAWDLDAGMRDPYGGNPKPWTINHFPIYFGRHPNAVYRQQPEYTIVRRLMRQDPRYAGYLAQLFSNMMNHEIDPRFLSARVDHYEAVAERLNAPKRKFLRRMREFLKQRVDVMRRQLTTYYGTGEVKSLVVDAPADATYTVDGYPKAGPFAGWYFERSPSRIEVSPAFEIIETQLSAGRTITIRPRT